MTLANPANAYSNTAAQAAVLAASPHKLISIQYKQIRKLIARAKHCMAVGNVKLKGQAISQAIDIIGHLNGQLDLQKGGQVAASLRQVYEICSPTLATANLRNDPGLLDHVDDLIAQIQEAWDMIGDQAA